MAPADQILIVAPPGAHLIRVVADEAGGAELLDRLPMARRRGGVAQHQLAAHVLAGVVAALRAGADVDELDRHVRALAVVGDREPHVVVRDDAPRLRLHFVEPSGIDAPAAVAVERAEPGRAVAGKRLDVHVGQAGGLRSRHHVLDRFVKAGRRGNAVQLASGGRRDPSRQRPTAPRPAPSALRDRAASRPAARRRLRGHGRRREDGQSESENAHDGSVAPERHRSRQCGSAPPGSWLLAPQPGLYWATSRSR